MEAILKKTIFLAVAALSCGFVACDEDGQDMNYNIKPGNVLYSPSTGIAIDLSKGESTTFEWAPSVPEGGGYVSYEVLFDKENGDFSTPSGIVSSQLTGSKSYVTLSARDLNTVARNAGIDINSTGTLKWTIRASKGLFGSIYSQANTMTVKTMNAMDPLPETVTLKGDATEDAEGIAMVASPGLNDKPANDGTFECFTRISNGSFTIEDDLGRYYQLNANGTMEEVETAVANSMSNGAGIYWIKVEFDGMVWSAKKVSKIELQATSNSVLGGKGMPGCEWKMFFTMTYEGKGVWAIKDYDNKMSLQTEDKGVTSSPGDSRHKFKMTLSDNTIYYFGKSDKVSLGTSYSTDFLKCTVWEEANINNTDWDKSWEFLSSDCGRPFDGYLYLNGDNAAGTFYHEYKFK
ncbi:SusE domain-containing protein [uncultured Alistipes sp.]|uniref:SusE domain-containing protein n=1 Tax=uncultured Alistipes sp. TaxID=538949 RepID=UPI0025E86685|nr:SusE domain-containing protein [uncultured Alistipes sp.]